MVSPILLIGILGWGLSVLVSADVPRKKSITRRRR
jgi:hypothetical protein